MGKGGEKWRRQVEAYFGFLPDLGFSTVEVDDGSFWSLWVQYRSPTGAVRIGNSTESMRAEVQLIRLVNAAVPPYPIWITDERIDWTHLDTVVEVRQPQLMAEVAKLGGRSASQLDEQLRFWARVLTDVAPDFLDGGFAAIDEAGALMRSRVAEEPQQVTVWLPGDAPAGSETKQINEIQATVPPNVGVSARRYWRGRVSRSNRRSGR